MERDKSNFAECQPGDNRGANILSDSPDFESHMAERQIAEKVGKIAEVESAFPDAIVTFDSARQLLYRDYTGKAYDCDESEVGFILPRYEIIEYKNGKMPPQGYEINYTDRSGSRRQGPTGAEMLQVNDMLMSAKSANNPAFQSDENISFFGMGKDEGTEGVDYKEIEIAALNGEPCRIKVETLPTHIDNTLFWALYNAGGKTNPHSAKEAERILEMTAYLTPDERERLDSGPITKGYIAKLEYLASADPDFAPTSSPDQLAAAREEATEFYKNKEQREQNRLDFLAELTQKYNPSTHTLADLSDGAKVALEGYEDRLEAALASDTSVNGDEFIKTFMASLSQDDIYRIIDRLGNESGPTRSSE